MTVIETPTTVNMIKKTKIREDSCEIFKYVTDISLQKQKVSGNKNLEKDNSVSSKNFINNTKGKHLMLYDLYINF